MYTLGLHGHQARYSPTPSLSGRIMYLVGMYPGHESTAYLFCCLLLCLASMFAMAQYAKAKAGRLLQSPWNETAYPQSWGQVDLDSVLHKLLPVYFIAHELHEIKGWGQTYTLDLVHRKEHRAGQVERLRTSHLLCVCMWSEGLILFWLRSTSDARTNCFVAAIKPSRLPLYLPRDVFVTWVEDGNTTMASGEGLAKGKSREVLLF